MRKEKEGNKFENLSGIGGRGDGNYGGVRPTPNEKLEMTVQLWQRFGARNVRPAADVAQNEGDS